MAIPVNIDDLINGRIIESTRIEYKEGWNPDPIIHTVCAFANDIDNAGGGYIVIGVSAREGYIKEVLGLKREEVDVILKDFLNACHHIEPMYRPIAEVMEYEGKYVIVAWVTAGYGRPYRASEELHGRKYEKKYYIRKFSSTVIATPDEEKELFRVSSRVPFDDQPNLEASVDDLSAELMREHLKEIDSRLYNQSEDKKLISIANDMQLLFGPPESIKPRNVAILMFSPYPEKYFRYARIEVVNMPDPTGRNMTERIFKGPIQRQLRAALMYIKDCTLEEKVIKHPDVPEAERVFNYPQDAIDEILANAVFHRSYQIEEPITVKITPTGIEVISFPGFDGYITDDDIKSKNIQGRTYRNRRIGDFLKELHLIESRNSGYPLVFEALEKNGSGSPIFKMDPNRQYLSVTIPIHPYFLPKVNEKDKAFKDKILATLGDNVMSYSELAVAMGYKGITKKLSTTIEDMLTNGTLRRVLSGARVKIQANHPVLK
ncbi:MAG: putative DNA binding domain-containing protein [Clostridia bacterium]|nr:putative DNA binding domain-containing protein [Clostridia bacterium]